MIRDNNIVYQTNGERYKKYNDGIKYVKPYFGKSECLPKVDYIKLQKNDLILICTRLVYYGNQEKKLKKFLKTYGEKIKDKLLKYIEENLNEHNYSVMAIQVDEIKQH